MKLLDHTRTTEGYKVRIWLDELGPDVVREYTWGPYKAPLTTVDDSGDEMPIDWDFTQKAYEQQHIDQAMKLAFQELAQFHPEPVVISKDDTAIEAQQTAVEDAKDQEDAA